MPPRRHVLIHPDTSLNDADRQALVAALQAMDRSGGDRSGPGGGEDG